MQEQDDDLRLEDQMEKSGYFDWLSENDGDLKAEFLTQYSVDELVQHFYWDESTMEEFWDYHSDSYDEYCKDSWDASQDWEATKRTL